MTDVTLEFHLGLRFFQGISKVIDDNKFLTFTVNNIPEPKIHISIQML